ncbi:MAG: ATP-binding cassette domain-containing protein [Clostridia bacterium]|jgi:ABC-type multidrug transport system ATPase subunit
MKLELISLCKNYGNIRALDNFSYTFEKGVYGIVGPNGAGKSTLMGIITDSLKRQSGTVLWNESDILKCGIEYRRLLGYMAQEQGLYETMTAHQFLDYMAMLKEIPIKEASVQIQELLEVMHLTASANRKLKGFSHGMRQRVLLIQALLGSPKVVILDEPTSGVDPMERISIRNHISKIAQDSIVLLATHAISDIECIANQVLLINKGKLVISDTPENLIKSIQGKVGEKYCTIKETADIQKEYGVCNIYQRHDGIVLRVVSDNLPADYTRVENPLGLEDVYLYYIKQGLE